MGDGIAERYARDGYAKVSGLVSLETLDAIASELAAVFARRAQSLGLSVPLGSDRESLTCQLEALFGHDPAVYMSAAKLSQHLVSVHRVGVSDEIVDLVRSVGVAEPAISTRPVIHYMSDGLKIDGGYHKTPSHQDWRSVQGSLDGVTLWIPLFDVTEDDYPVEVVAKSHRRGLLPSADHAFGHCVTDGTVEEDTFVPLTLRRGEGVIFSGFLVHRTGFRGGRLARVALSYRFNNAAEETFVQRGYPDRYIYRAEKPLLFAEFPKEDQVAATFERINRGEIRS